MPELDAVLVPRKWRIWSLYRTINSADIVPKYYETDWIIIIVLIDILNVLKLHGETRGLVRSTQVLREYLQWVPY